MKTIFYQKKNLFIKKSFINQIMVYLLICYCILFPADKINIKEIILILTIGLCYLSVNKLRIQKYIFFYGIIWPILLIIYAIIRGVPLGSAMSYGYVWVFILLLPIIWRIRIDIKPPFIISTYIVALIIDFIMLCDIFGIISIFLNPVGNFFVNIREIPNLGKGTLATFGYSIFYKSSPLILVTYGYFIYKKKYICSLPLIIALLGSGTRANFLMAIFISVAIPILCIKKPVYKIIIVLLIVAVGMYLAPIMVNKMIALNALKHSRSESIKLADAKVIFFLLKKNIFNFLFGTGVGSSFLSPRGKMMTTFELSYIDFLRQTGITGMFIFIFIIIKPIKKLWIEKRWLLVCFLSYLAVAFTNPLLITSTSFMLYLLVYSEAFSTSKKTDIRFLKK